MTTARKRNIESDIYRGLRTCNDLKAVRNGRIGKRIQRRILGRFFSKLMRELVK